MSVFGADALATEASPKPQLPRRVAPGSSPRHPESGSSLLLVTADPRLFDRRRHRVMVKMALEARNKYPYAR